MKKIMLIVALAMPFIGRAQTITFDTDDYKSIGVYDTWDESPFRTGKLSGNVAVVSNHLQDVDETLGVAPNPTENILAFQRSRFGSNTFGAKIELKNTFELTTTTRYVHVLINKPKEGRVMLVGLGKRTERADQSKDAEQFWVFSKNSVEPNKWVDAVFPIKGNGGIDIYSLVVIPDCESSHTLTGDFAVYIDQIIVNDEAISATTTDFYPINYDKKTQCYTRSDRGLNSVGFTGQTISVSRGTSATIFSDKTDKQLQAKPGQTITPTFNYTGTWMSGYVYVDYGKDGKFSYNINDDGTPGEGSDIVTYSFYNNKNSKGASVANGNILTQPTFTIPAETPYGFYRMRYKVDWNCIDPAGNITDNNSILQNGGAYVDTRLNIHGDEVSVSENSRNGEVLAGDGTKLNSYKTAFGKAFTIKMNPERGFSYSGIRLRHGYNLAGDSLVYDTPQYEDVYFTKDQFKDDVLTVPASCVDGDIEIEGLFTEIPPVVERYPVNFDKDTERTHAKRYVKSITLDNTTVTVADASKMYYDLTDRVFTARAGKTAQPSINFSTDWMDGYVYIDKDNNGQYDVKEIGEKGALTEDNDLVSFSGLTLTDGLYNSAGTQLSNLSSLATPSFSLPSEMKEGYYMMRYKVDWDSSNPAGSLAEGNDIIKNGGAIIDVRLRILAETDKTANVSSATDGNGTLLLFNGEELDGQKVNIGEGFTISAVPEKGYKLSSVCVRHGKLDGDSIKDEVAQYADSYIDISKNDYGLVDITADCVDGDLEIYATFEPTDEEIETYACIFDEEFNQEDGTQPDPEKWTTSTRRNAAWNRFIVDDERVTYIQDGALVCHAMANPEYDADATEAPANLEMISGAKETNGKFSFTYGRVDIRLKTTHHTGNFPAAWMMPQPPTLGWPNAGEIDIFETINSQNTAYHTVHSNWTYNLGKTGSPKSSFSESVTVEDWHIYSLIWEEDILRWLVDGTEVCSYAKSTEESDLDNGQWPFTRPFYIILNQSVGNGSWASGPDTSFKYETRFDYVRVYQKTTSTGIGDIRNARRADNRLFDLQGRQVSAPQKGGIYIQNGKKVIF